MKKYYCLDCNKEISRHGVRCKSCAIKFRIKKGFVVPSNRKKIDTKKLMHLYLIEKLSCKKISRLLNIHSKTVSKILKENSIKISPDNRKREHIKYYCKECGKEVNRSTTKLCHKCESKGRCEENNPCWKGGNSNDYYRRLARENLRQECFKCGSKKNLCVHHKDKNRKNNDLFNLMMLCRSCHTKEHDIQKNLRWDYNKLKAEKKKIIQEIKKISEQELSDKVKKVVINKIREIK